MTILGFELLVPVVERLAFVFGFFSLCNSTCSLLLCRLMVRPRTRRDLKPENFLFKDKADNSELKVPPAVVF